MKRYRVAALIAFVLVAGPWALRGYVRWWELALGARCGAATEWAMPRNGK